jgi:hypothetical protein
MSERIAIFADVNDAERVRLLETVSEISPAESEIVGFFSTGALSSAATMEDYDDSHIEHCTLALVSCGSYENASDAAKALALTRQILARNPAVTIRFIRVRPTFIQILERFNVSLSSRYGDELSEGVAHEAVERCAWPETFGELLETLGGEVTRWLTMIANGCVRPPNEGGATLAMLFRLSLLREMGTVKYETLVLEFTSVTPWYRRRPSSSLGSTGYGHAIEYLSDGFVKINDIGEEILDQIARCACLADASPRIKAAYENPAQAHAMLHDLFSEIAIGMLTVWGEEDVSNGEAAAARLGEICADLERQLRERENA